MNSNRRFSGDFRSSTVLDRYKNIRHLYVTYQHGWLWSDGRWRNCNLRLFYYNFECHGSCYYRDVHRSLFLDQIRPDPAKRWPDPRLQTKSPTRPATWPFPICTFFNWHAWHDGAEVSASGWRSGGPRFKSHPRLISQSWSSYQLNQLGSKAASDSTLKQLTLAGYQILVLYFYFTLIE